MLMASSKVSVTIWGTLVHLSFSGHKSPGTSVPSSEQKQSGSLHNSLSQIGALFGSVSASRNQTLTPLFSKNFWWKLTTNVLIRPISTVCFSITEKIPGNTSGISTGEFIGAITQRSVCHQERLHLLLPCQLITVLHSPFPVTSLLLKIKCKSWRTSDGLKTLEVRKIISLLFYKLTNLQQQCTG